MVDRSEKLFVITGLDPAISCETTERKEMRGSSPRTTQKGVNAIAIRSGARTVPSFRF